MGLEQELVFEHLLVVALVADQEAVAALGLVDNVRQVSPDMLGQVGAGIEDTIAAILVAKVPAQLVIGVGIFGMNFQAPLCSEQFPTV